MSGTLSTSSQYTREQTLALATDRHLIVSAGAGSGKTSVLVERYIQILLSGTDPRHIVAITFTRKAAAEMLTRIGSRLDARFENATTPDELRLLRHVRERLTNARISTIHSFCSRLLREFPIEAGVSPNFTDLQESELFTIRQRAVTEVMEQWLEDESRRERARNLMLDIDRQTVFDILMSLAAHSEDTALLNDFYRATTDAEILARRTSIFRLMLGNGLSEQLSALSTLFPHSVEIANPSKDFATALGAYNEFLLHNLPFIHSNDFDEFCSALSGLHAVLSTLFTATYTPRKRVAQFIESSGLFYPWDVSASFAELLDGIVSSFEYRMFDEQMVAHARTLNDMAEHALILIHDEKDEAGGLDFDDMQQRCLALLDNESVRSSLRRSIRYLMLDEFQDTNPLQYSIAKKLVEALDSPEANGGTNIFIVGDAKQSIYGFRNADVRVFAEARQDVIAANDSLLQRGVAGGTFTNSEFGTIAMSDSEQHGDIRLNASFRLVPQLVAFVNRVCRTVMPAEQHGYDVAYEEMIASRPASISQPAHIEFLAAQRHAASAQSSDEVKARAARHQREHPSEAELIAQRIDDIVNGASPLHIYASTGFRPAGYGDIAILARKKNIFSKLAKSLAARGIPYHIHGGTPFFQQPEILDMMSILEFFNNPSNDIALAAVLRSPFFALRSSDLFLLTLDSEGDSLWEKFRHAIHQHSSALEPHVHESFSTLCALLYVAPHIPIPQLIRRVLHSTLWYGVTATDVRADEMTANIEHLLMLAREFEGRGFKNLYDFVAELRTSAAISKGSDGPSAQMNTDSVALMTIHASKGLEFPIVVLADTNSSSRTSSLYSIHDSLGLCFSLYNDQDKKLVGSPLAIASRGVINAKEDAEAKRLLYVALTRAKDHLFCSMTLKVNHKSDGTQSLTQPSQFASMLLHAAEFAIEIPTNRTTELRDSIRITAQAAPEPILYQIHFTTTIPQQHYTHFSTAAPSPIHPDLSARIQSQSRGEIYSASQLLLYLSNPTAYIHRYKLGMPVAEDERLRAPQNSIHEHDSIQGTLAGTVIHHALAHIHEWCDHDGRINDAKLQDRVATSGISLSIAVQGELYARVLQDIRALCSTNFIRQSLPSIIPSPKEQSLIMPLGDDFLQGTLDMIFNNGGVYEVWDWKTNRISETPPDAWLQHYRTQLQVYAYLLLHAYPNQPHCTARLIFTRDGSDVSMTIHRSDLPMLTEQFQKALLEMK
ncbi:MAG: UvrD-helicase domain-containing protein [Candidatus Kapabacteria bacterium]|nr:UvrD-helicase domain-containing protein [Candidatus Kapabacteria bacterium]